MSCTVDDRQRVEHAARAIRDAVPTEAVDTLPPAKSPHDAWTLDAAIPGDGIPPSVLRELALADLTLRQTPPQADYEIVVATA